MQAMESDEKARLSIFELGLLIFTLAALGLLALDTVRPFPGDAGRIARWLDHFACALFFVDFCVRFARADSKATFLKWGWIDLLACIPFVSEFRYARVVRVLRVIRLLRGVRLVQRLREILRHQQREAGATSLVLTAILLVVFSSISILICEQSDNANIRTAEDALWWSVTTLTTVGYGDKVPVTTEGRALAMGLMVAGAGMFGALTGLVASLFVGDKGHRTPELQSVILQLEAIKSRLDRVIPEDPPPPEQPGSPGAAGPATEGKGTP
jgi:voltage-gated potassium channel